MLKKFFSVFIIIVSLILLSGCWGKKELNELGIISAIGIDKSETGYEITVQKIIPTEVSGKAKTAKSPVVVYTAEGDSVLTAIRKLTHKMSRRAFFSHMFVVVYGEEMARSGIAESVDLMIRDPEVRGNVEVFIARELKAKDVLKVLTHSETIPGSKIQKVARNIETNYSSARVITVFELLNMIVSKGTNPTVPGITVEGDLEKGAKAENVQTTTPESLVKLESVAVLKNDRLIGWMNEQYAHGLNHIRGEVKSTVLSKKCSDSGNYVIEVTKASTSISVDSKSKVPKFTIEHSTKANIGEMGCTLDLTKSKNIDQLEKIFEEEVRNQMEDTIKHVQTEFSVDIFGFGEVLHRQDPKLWKKLKKDWDNYFTNELNVTYDVKIDIERPGVTKDQLIKDMKPS